MCLEYDEEFGELFEAVSRLMPYGVQVRYPNNTELYEDFSVDGDEHYIVKFPFLENEYHYDILLSFGDQCECLEPLHIRAEMKRRIQNIAIIYES